ncbi:hypothetical protein [Vibrio vulnificus]|uniref:hypothetical protein n=1 Tax=Vibrio vulnificus TaxID=672 RepID=UPI001028B991|nr:hypothetical protein [Vibrio vulnificus]EGQ7950920.1 hypothetical protein [Vibrio vulnificus]
MAWLYRFIASVAVGFALVFVCYCECVANTRILPRVDEWIPVCTGMTAGGADQLSHPVILANVGIYCMASAVVWFYRFITGVSVDLATLSPRHPHERGDLLYSEHRGLVLSHHYWCFC